MSSPSETDAPHFYYGLPSEPRLIATTNPTRWQPGNTTYTFLLSVSRHEILEKWAHASPLQVEVLKVMQDIAWTSIDVVRIRYDLRQGDDIPVVLWIGVTPGSLPQANAFSIVEQCKVILTQHGLDDVGCEMRESVVSLGVNEARPLLAADYPPPSGVNHFLESFEGKLGGPIASMAAPETEGSQGLFLSMERDSKIAREPRVLSLTCGHVALPTKLNENQIYNREQRGEQLHQMILPGQGTFEAQREGLLGFIEVEKEKQRKKLLKRNPLHAGNEVERITDESSEQTVFRQVLKELDDRSDVQDRVFGEVEFSPPIAPANEESWIMDWSLIGINTRVFSEGPHNSIDLDAHPREVHKFKEVFDLPGTLGLSARLPQGSLRLHGILKVSEICETRVTESGRHACFIVGKKGRSSQVTWGWSNESMSIVNLSQLDGMKHHFKKGTEIVTGQAWGILSAIPDTAPFYISNEPFSKTGDSGAAVFDTKGRVAGMLFGGSGAPLGKFDISYAMPMEWLLKNVQEASGIKVDLL